MPRIVLVLALIIASGQICLSQVIAQLKGQVITADKQPLPLATVSLVAEDGKVVVSTPSDTGGNFKLGYGIQGKYTLAVSHTAYLQYKSAVFQLANKDFGTVVLTSMTHSLKDVVIQSKQNVVELDGSNIVYNVSKTINAQGVSAFEALKKAPGVFIDNDNTISVNGKQGAVVLLDGKQTYLSGKEIADLLKSMPSSAIRSIEIINNPTAKYDAAGSAGLINIRTSKSQVKGFNGTMTTGISYGVSLKQNQDIAFNYRKDKFNVFGNYNHFFGNYSYLYGSDRIQNNKTYTSFTDDTDKRSKIGSRLGADYIINKNHTIGVLVNGNFIFGGGITLTNTDIGTPGSNRIEQVLDASNDYYSQSTKRYNINLNYKYEDTLGRIINIDADYGFYNKGSGNLQSNKYTDDQNAVLSQNLYRSLNGTDIDLKALKLDYTANLWRGKVEAGAKYSSIKSATDSRFLLVLPGSETLDERRSNDFAFNEQISSAYVNYKRSAGKWTIQAGLRMENSSSTGTLRYKINSSDSLQRINRNYTNLFPSFSIAVKPADNHSFSLGYSRRIDRPAYQDLNPFVYLLDELSYWQGNPFLQPQLTHRGTLQYAYRSATIIGLTYAYTDQYSARITDTTGGARIVMIPRNLGVQKNIALSVTQNVAPAPWWEITFNGTFYQIRNQIAFDRYRNFNLKQTAARLSLQQSFKMPCKITGELLSYYNSKRLAGANEVINPTSQVDVGLQRGFSNNKILLRLAVSDIYKGTKTTSFQSFNGFYLRNYAYYEARQFRFNLTYRFANSSVKGPRSRNSALENENGRIK